MPASQPQIKVQSFGPKDFLQGISPLQIQQSAFGGFFAQATGVDLYRYPGFICPGASPTTFSQSNLVTDLIVSLGGTNPNVSAVFGSSSAKLYEILLSNNTVTSANGFPHTYSGQTAANGNSILIYAIQGTKSLFYFEDQDIGKTDMAGSFTDNWGSTVPAGAASLINTTHRAVVLNAICYFTNGNSIGKLDGTIGTNGTLTPSFFTIPPGYMATDIQIVKGNLEIYATNAGVLTPDPTFPGQAIVITWDGVNPLATDISAIEDNLISSGKMLDGFPYIFSAAKQAGVALRRKNFYGYPQIQVVNNNGTANLPNPTQADVSNSMLVWGDSNTNKIWAYGTPFPTYSLRGSQDAGAQFPEALHNIIVPSGTNVGALINANKNQLVVSSKTGSTYYLELFPLSNASSFNNASASFKTNFIQLPDDSVIKWVRVYVLPPSTGAAFTLSLYTDFGTSPTFTSSDDLTSSTLDANGKSKTFYVNDPMCDNFAIGGNWANSSGTSNSIIITRIDVGFITK